MGKILFLVLFLYIFHKIAERQRARSYVIHSLSCTLAHSSPKFYMKSVHWCISVHAASVWGPS